MHGSWINDSEEFNAIASRWDEALTGSGSYNPFLLSDFVISWLRNFKESVKPDIFVVYDNDRILGGIPLYTKKGGWREGYTSVMRHIGGAAANYTEPFFTLNRENFLEVLKRGLQEVRACDALCLPDVRPENVLVKDSPAFCEDKNFRMYYTADHMNWAIDLSMGKEKYFASLSKKMLKDLRAKRRHAIGSYGPIKLTRIRGDAEIGRYFALYQEYSLQAFKGRMKLSTFEDKRYANFFREFLMRMDKNNRLDAHVLRAGDKVLAISFGYRFGPGFNWVLTGFNYECRYVRPGYLLIEELINELLERGETYYNWYGYERFYKEQWCNHTQPLYRFFLIKTSFAGGRYDLLRKTEHALRSNPWAVELARKLKRA